MPSSVPITLMPVDLNELAQLADDDTRGKYLVLLWRAWAFGPVPRQFIDQWQHARQFFVETDSGWVNETIERYRREVALREKRRARAARRAARVRWESVRSRSVSAEPEDENATAPECATHAERMRIACATHDAPHIDDAQRMRNASRRMQAVENQAEIAMPQIEFFPSRARLIPDSDSFSGLTSSVSVTTSHSRSRAHTHPHAGAREEKPLSAASFDSEKNNTADDVLEVHRQAGAIATALRDRGVRIESQNPIVHEWIERGLTLSQLLGALALAREVKPEPELIAARYLAAIVRQSPWEATVAVATKSRGARPREFTTRFDEAMKHLRGDDDDQA